MTYSTTHRWRPLRTAAAVAVAVATLAACTATETPDDQAAPTGDASAPAADRDGEDATPAYRDASLPVEDRIEDLLARMTLREKIAQMTLPENGSVTPEDVAEHGLGAVLSGGGGAPDDNSVEGWTEMVRAYQEAALGTELGIPLLYGVDAVHGHNLLLGATVFPHNIGLGATRDADLVERIGRITAVETMATGIHWAYSPVLAVPQDIRWGRTYEGFSEDTEVVTELGHALFRGLQQVDGPGDLARPDTVLATPKHFVGDGGTAWGTSFGDPSQGFLIDQGDTPVDEATLRAVHLPPYVPVVADGALSVMASYSSVDGLKMHAHRYLLTDVLKGELGFEGFVVSDWGAIDKIDDDYAAAVATAIDAGIDVNMVPSDWTFFMDVLEEAVEDGRVETSRIDDAVRRVLRAKFALGLFEQPFGDPSLAATVGSDEHRAVAREAVAASAVLLRTDGEVLPLARDAGTILVSGSSADDTGRQAGGWTVAWQGVPGLDLPGSTSILDGIREAAGADTEVLYDRRGEFDEVGPDTRADVGVVVIGEAPYAEGIGDDGDLEVPTGLVTAMAEVAERVVVVVVSGRPVILDEAADAADAWVAAWLPGSEGAGVADVLFGDVPFTGTLPVTWPRNVGQLPVDRDAVATSGCASPLFPFGWGLATDGSLLTDVPAADTAPWGQLVCEGVG